MEKKEKKGKDRKSDPKNEARLKQRRGFITLLPRQELIETVLEK